MNPNNESCESCRNWQPTVKTVGLGNCRMNPPVRSTIGNPEETKSFTPLTPAAWWCSQHMKATPEQMVAHGQWHNDPVHESEDISRGLGQGPTPPSNPVAAPASNTPERMMQAPLAEVPASPMIQHAPKKKI
jgi:hypothetical protein